MGQVLFSPPRADFHTPSPPYDGHRHAETWKVAVLDQEDQVLHALSGVRAASIENSIHTTIRSSGSLTVDEPGRVDWHRIRVQVFYEFVDEAGAQHSHPQGVFLPTSPSTNYDGMGATAEIDLYDKMTILDASGAGSTWTVDKGTTVADAVLAVLDSVGETRAVYPDDKGGTLRSQMAWAPGESRLRIINDILKAGNFFSIWVDGRGVWQMEPYRKANSRGVEHVFREGVTATFFPDIKHEADGWRVPNEVVMLGRADDEGEAQPPYAVARNEDPDDPFSIPGRGYSITLTEEDQDAVNDDVLGALAARRLIEVSGVTSNWEIQHAWRPIDLNSAVRLEVPSQGIDVLATYQSWSWSWDADGVPGLVSGKLREVANE